MQIGSAKLNSAVRSSAIWVDAVWVVAFAVMLAVSAQIRFYPPGGLVPVTLQSAVVLLCGFWLRPRLAAAAVGLYLAAGFLLVGAAPSMTVFAAFALGKTLTLGYLVGFLAAAVVVSTFNGQMGRLTFGRAMAVALLGTGVIFACGLGWLTLQTGSLSAAVQQGLAPFAGWALIKAAATASLAAAAPIRR